MRATRRCGAATTSCSVRGWSRRMRLVDAAARLALAVAVGCAVVPARAAGQDYGKVETFQPGKKYNCVPTPDHKGWDCRELGGKNGDAKGETPVPARAASTAPAAEPKAASAESKAPPAEVTSSA